MRTYGLFMEGEMVEAGSRSSIPVIDPNTSEQIGTIAVARPDDVDRAVGSAVGASEQWASLSGDDRAELLIELADAIKAHGSAITEMEVHDAGQCRAGAITRVAASWLRRYAELGRKVPQHESIAPAIPGMTVNYVDRRPFGACALIVPYNAPLLMSIIKIGPALASGNTCVVKPSELASTPVMELARIIADHTSLPPGVVNIVTGDGDVGQQLVADPRIAMISFTGSTGVGQQIMQSAAVGARKVLLELGGKSAHIVLDDVDIEDAARSAVFAAFLHQGQACIAGTRLLIPKKLEHDLVEAIRREVMLLTIGASWAQETQVGPMINRAQRDKAVGFVERAVAGGAKLACGGTIPELTDGLGGGAFLVPAVVTNVHPMSELAQDEVFGPVLAVSTYDSDDDAVRIANLTRFGLAGGVTGRDLDRCRAVADRLNTGTIWINSWHHMHPEAPFGGFGLSGVGRELGTYGMDEYQQLRHVHVHTDADRPNPLREEYFSARR